jgi:predicted MPP superfamily phosphohydrolase
MGSTIRWLHLTDLHVGVDDQDWLWPRMRGQFREDLKNIYKMAGPWDLVLFTGDLVQKGIEYTRFDEIFDDIWGWFAELGCDPMLLAVPGNHDLQWRNAKDPVVKMLHKWATDADVREGFWNEPSGKYRQTVKDAFAEYETWWRGASRKPNDVQHGLLPGDFSYTLTKDGLCLGIVGLNSAFLQLTEKKGRGNFQGHLVVDPRQFQAACGGDGVKWAESHQACFLMTHHPPEWLNKESRDHLDAEIIESFSLHLCGHNHETQVLQELTGGAEHAPLRWLGRSLFGLEKARNGKLDRSHGYVAGELRVADDNAGEIQFMPRRSVLHGTRWSLVPDQSVKLRFQNERTRAFPILLRPVGVEMKLPLAIDSSSSADDAEAINGLDGGHAEVAAHDSTAEPASPPTPKIDDRSAPVKAEREEPDPKASFIANELLQAVCDQLNSEAEPFRTLRAELIRRLTEEANDDTETNVDFLVQAVTEKLNEVMSTLRMWLDSTDRMDEGEEVRRLIDAVSTAGFDAAWIEALLTDLKARHLHVPIETDLHLCEVIFTAIYRKPATWTRDREIDHGAIRAIATSSTKPHERAREIRRRLVQTYFQDRISREVGEGDADYEKRLDDWARRDLPGVLEAEREDQKPWFVLFLETVDALKKDMEIDPPLWSQILKLEKSRQPEHFVYDRPKLQDRLTVMHKRLDKLDAKARKGPRP